MSAVVSLAAACLFLFVGIVFILGKGVFILERLHVVPEDENGTYDSLAISRFVGFVSLLFALGSFLRWIGRVSNKDFLVTAGFFLYAATGLFVLIYFNTGERFWVPREDYVPFSNALEIAEESAAEKETVQQIEAELSPISLRGRVAYGAACLEQAVDSLDARTPEMEEYLTFLWSFTSAILFDEWEEQAKGFAVEGREEFSARFGLDGAEPGNVEILFRLYEESLKAATENLKGTHSQFTIKPTVRLVKLMQENGFFLPSIEPFRLSPAEESGGWGDPRKPEFFQKQ